MNKELEMKEEFEEMLGEFESYEDIRDLHNKQMKTACKQAKEEGRRGAIGVGVLMERERIAKSLNQNLPPAGKFMYKDIIQDALNKPILDNCFKCGKEVPKPEDSPKDRKRWVDKCEECKNK